MAKTAAPTGRNGGAKKQVGGEAKQEAATAALARTPEEVVALVEEATAADFFEGIHRRRVLSTINLLSVRLTLKTRLEWILARVQQLKRATRVIRVGCQVSIPEFLQEFLMCITSAT
jgi:hypothetical protein